MLDLFIILELT